MRKRRAAGPHAIVTGAGGFLGSVVVAELLSEGWRVSALGHGVSPRSWPGHETTLACVAGDVTLEALHLLATRYGPPALVVHAAGTGTVGAATRQPDLERERTVGLTRLVVEFLLRQAPEAVLIYPSSAAVYGDTGRRPVREDHAPCPLSAYARFKVEAEAVCREALRRGLRSVILRFTSLYGPGLRKQLLWDVCQRFAAGARDVWLTGSGKETRDLLYGRDAARIVARIHHLAARATHPDVVNAGSGQSRTIHDIVIALRDAWGLEANVRFDRRSSPDNPRHMEVDTRVLTLLGLGPQTTFEQGIRAYVDWAKAELDVASPPGSAGVTGR